MFGRKLAAIETSQTSTPIHKMSAVERLAESMERVISLHKHFAKMGMMVKLEGMTLIVSNEKNHYFIDVADDDPRFIKMQTIYQIENGDKLKPALACALATDKSYAAKAIVRSDGLGYRLHFVVELVVAELSHFTGLIGIYQGAIESCREAYIKAYQGTAEHQTMGVWEADFTREDANQQP